ncbi:ATP-binding protein [Streptomyces sp. NPDC013978]|uniref:ATP-binding protein n=1 Tax=Streptomyces sp. NPDC013978 TaxID=3364869 RepID=UPI0036FA0FBA
MTDDGEVRVPSWSMAFRFCVASVPEVRAHVRNAVTAWGCDADLVGDAELVAAELAANAVLHGQAPGWELFTVRLVPGASGLTVEVDDGSPQLPKLVRHGENDEGGRGLLIIEALSQRWGADLRAGSGKRTWALLTMRVHR